MFKRTMGYKKKLAVLCLVFTIISSCMNVVTFAAVNVNPDTFIGYAMEGATSGVVEINTPTWAELTPSTSSSSTALTDKQKYYASVKGIFKNEQEYNKWCYDIKSKAKWDAQSGALTPNAEVQGAPTEKEFGEYNKVVSQFNKYQGRNAVAGLTANIFKSDEFNPADALVMGFMEGFYSIVNALFSVFAQLTFWLFLAQTGADCLYIAIPMTRKFLALAGENDLGFGNGGMGGMGGMGSGQKSSWFKINLVSREAIEACQARYGAGRAGGFTGDSMGGKKNVFFTYFGERAPVILLITTYAVLVAANLWPVLISWVAGFVAQVLAQIFA